MDFNDLWNIWLQGHKQQNLRGFEEANWLTPEDIGQFEQAFSPYDLYMKPSTIPYNLPTIAFTKKDVTYPETYNDILMVSRNPKDNFSTLRGPESYFSLYPNLIPAGRVAPQKVYQHELGHKKDIRFYQGFNRGFLTKGGQPNATALEAIENPAWQREENWFKYFLKMIGG